MYGIRYGGLTPAIALGLLLLPAAAAAESTPAVDFGLRLTSERPSTLTGLDLHILYKNPSDPNAKPPALTKLMLEAPEGTRFDGAAVSACHASDQELMARGRDACPDASRVGGGNLTVMTGFGPPVDPFATDATLFNSGDGIVELFTQKGSNTALGTDRTKFGPPNTLTAHPPTIPGGPPDGKTAVRDIRFNYKPIRGAGGKAFITTPPDCPSRGLWISRLTFSYADGNTYHASSTTTCLKGKRKPALRLSITPRHVRAGRRVRFRLHVRSSTPACARGAKVRFGNRRARTNRHGRATLVLRVHRSGLRRAVASKPGCSRGTAPVGVRRRR